MPRPPVLPLIDWPEVFASGQPYAEWRANSEEQDNARSIDALREALVLPSPLKGFLAALPRPVHVVAIAEAWCGDVVRHVPALAKMAEATDKLKLRFIGRAQHPDVFARFLTNGGEAIPKFVFLSSQFVECGHWGPMPAACRELIARGKACGDVDAARRKVSAMYEADPDLRIVLAELGRLIDIAASETP